MLAFLIMMDPNFRDLEPVCDHHPGCRIITSNGCSVPTLAFIAIILMVGWKGFPFFALIMLSSLQTIPDDLYAGGGGRRRRGHKALSLCHAAGVGADPGPYWPFWRFIFSFQQFSIIYLSTGGGPGTDTSTLSVTIYLQAFEFFNYNYASAIAVVGLFLALCGTVLFIFVERRLTRSHAV